MCDPKPICYATEASADALVDKITSSVDAFIDSVTPALTSLGTLWVKVKTPDLTGGGEVAPRGHAADAESVLTVLGYVSWIGFAIAIIAVIILGAMIATRMRAGEGVAAVGRIGIVLGAVIMISSASSLVALVLPSGPQGVGGATGYIQASLWWYMAAAAIVSVIIGGIRMAWEQRLQPGMDTLKSVITLVVVSGAGVSMVGILIKAADSFSAWVIDGALDCSLTDANCFPASVAKLLHLNNHSDPDGVGGAVSSLLVMGLIALLALLSTLIQIVLLIARSGMLVILAGVLPIAASATNTENGKTWFRKCVSWLIGFLLYKPAAAIVYAAAFKLFGNSAQTTDDLIAMLTGVMLMVLAVFALPAILRFVSPMAAGAAGGAASGAATVAALSALPSGARSAGGGSAGGAVGGAVGRLAQLGSGSGASGAGSGGSQRAGGGRGSGSGSSGSGGPGMTGSSGSQGVGGAQGLAGAAGSLGKAGRDAADTATRATAGAAGAGSGSAAKGSGSATSSAGSGSGGISGGPTGNDKPRGRRYASTGSSPSGAGGGGGGGGGTGGGSGEGGGRSRALVAAQLASGAAQGITDDSTGGGQG
ncbi:hypothetical protein [Microlunatus soli]|uniref:TrbL/VirB6 plasmid conjugal transfer protein n=1 Tax=Microlunatus soli TaxID=630515 RepID=A0A1H1T1T1_9ACTN|nr:hypothetical protein [Microlunatus soli]SDS54190.1 hypothetical protein SAMN04489812_2222 [Microlunatus soli]